MDFHAESEKRKQRNAGELGDLAYERYKLCKSVEKADERIAEIDELIARREAVVSEINQVQKDFNTYLAVKENALTLGDIKQSVEGKQNTED